MVSKCLHKGCMHALLGIRPNLGDKRPRRSAVCSGGGGRRRRPTARYRPPRSAYMRRPQTHLILWDPPPCHMQESADHVSFVCLFWQPQCRRHMHTPPGHQVKKERENESEKGREGERTRSRGRRTVGQCTAGRTQQKMFHHFSRCCVTLSGWTIEEGIGWNMDDSVVGGKQGRKVDTMRPHVKVNWPQGEAEGRCYFS